LLGGALTQSVLTPGVDARIAGFGYTNAQPVFGQHSGTGSPRLKQVTLPLIARDECIRIVAQAYDKPASGFSHIDAATVCAGDIAGGRDSCNGDSGGPLSLDIDNRRVQVGIVSWGPGCAVKNTVGVYASVPYFEPWIKQRVPDAVFVTRREQTPPRPTPGPAPTPSTEPCELPPARAASPGLLVDIAEGNRVPVGTPIHIRVSSHLQGQVAVLNVDTQTCRAYQVFPNKHSSASLPTGVGAVTIPGPNDAFVIKVNPPTGRNRLYAIAVSPDARVSDILMRGADMRSVPDVRSLWREIEARVSPRAQSTTPFAMFEYTIAQ
jgi:hypothetical protein